MDRSLWLLRFLRVRGWLRGWGRGVRTLKGAILVAAGSLVFLPLLGAFFFAPRIMIGVQLDAIRRFGPLGLLAYCVLNVLFSSGDRAIHYSPAEVDFLFCGPYPPRQILIYKIAGGFLAGAVTALLMAFALSHHAASFVAAFAGLFLSLELIYLFSLSVGLIISTIGVSASSRGRRLLLTALGLLTAGVIWRVARGTSSLPAWELVSRVLNSPALAILLGPFRPFVRAFAAERVWPDLVAWSALAALVDLALLVLILVLHVGFLEAAAAASAASIGGF